MKEHDIEIDIECINEIFINIFNSMFNDEKFIVKMLGKRYENVIALSHNKLDCYMLFKIVKWAYGSSNCINIWKEQLIDKRRSNFVAVNDLINRYIHDKAKLNKSTEMRQYANEVKDFLAMKLNVGA